IKGKAEPVGVQGLLGGHLALRRRSVTQPPLFGRGRELVTLQKKVAGLRHGRGQLILMVGEVGTGKTLLLETLHHRTTVRWAGGSGLAYGPDLSSHLFVGLLRDLLGLPLAAPPEETRNALTALCTTLWGEAGHTSAIPYLARFMGLPLNEQEAQQVGGLSGESFRWQLFRIIKQLVRRLLAQQPLVLALDDLQWTDTLSLQLIEQLVPLVESQPLLLLLSTRLDAPEPLRQRVQALHRRVSRSYFQEMTLGPLDDTTARALVHHFAPHLSDPLLAHLVDKSGGNPLFLVELVRTLQVQGLADLAQPLSVEGLELPDSIQGLLLAQLDRLPVEARQLLQRAAVIGRRFPRRVLAALAEDIPALDETLLLLEQQAYLQQEQATTLGPTYLFRHSLIQESAYSTLLYEYRRVYHRAVAGAIQHLFPALLGEQAGVLAFHYEHAADLEQALYFYLQAADQARFLYATEEAETLYNKALALLEQRELPDAEQHARLYLKLAQLRTNGLDFEAAQLFYERAFEWLEQVHHRARASQSGRGKARVFRLGVGPQGLGTLDPALGDVGGEAKIVEELFEGLVELDMELNVLPAVARRWRVDQEGRCYRFELRPALRWSDGQPLCAHDFVFGWRRTLDPQTDSVVAHLLYIVEGAEAFHQGQVTDPATIGIRAVDDLTLEITLRAPSAYFPYLLADPSTYPQPAHLIAAKGDAWHEVGTLVGNGPFVIQQGDEGVELLPNPFYRGVFPGNLECISIHPVQPDVEAFHQERIDWCRIEEQLPPSDAEEEGTFLLQHLSIFFLAFSCRAAPFQEKAWRQLFAAAIDQKALVHEVWNDGQKAATGGMIPPGMVAHSPEMPLPSVSGQLQTRAVRDLPEPLILAALPGFRTTPHYLRQRWQDALGIRVEVRDEMPVDELLEQFEAGKIHLALLGWEAEYPDPDNVLRGLFHGESPLNYQGWRSALFDQCVEKAAVATELEERVALYRQADQIVVQEEAAAVPLYYQQSYGLLRQGFRLEGVSQIIRGDRFKLKHIRRL
nr:AAA family ATPase [Ardenticatenales bacterium]